MQSLDLTFCTYPIWVQSALALLEGIVIAYSGQRLYYIVRRKPLPPLHGRLPSLALMAGLISGAALILQHNLRTLQGRIAMRESSAHSTYPLDIARLERPLWLSAIDLLLIGALVFLVMRWLSSPRFIEPTVPLRNRLFGLIVILVIVVIYAVLSI